MSYTLITANRNYSSWSLRPWLLMTTLGIAFDDRVEPFAAPDNHAAFRAFSPTGQVPVLIDGDRTIWDSLGITLYLAERHPGIWPADAAARAWAMCAVAEMHGGFGALRSLYTMNVGVRVAPPVPGPALARDIARIDALWGDGLARFGGPFLAGPAFTAADAFYAPVVFRWRTYGFALNDAARQWCRHMLSLPEMQAWEAAALNETWREAGHEAELASCGRIIADHRRS